MSAYLLPSDLLMPDFTKIDGSKWAVVACDQYTSQPEYWKEVEELVGDTPSTLRLILPECYLGDAAARVPAMQDTMEDYVRELLCAHRNKMLYVERTQANGLVRRGLVGMVDLECYDYTEGTGALIRATEQTVPERISPRLEARRGAVLEAPHAMLLIDDRQKSVIEPIAARSKELALAYDFDLMLESGHVKGYFVDTVGVGRVAMALEKLLSPEVQAAKYGADVAPLLFAVGDGNHSLAAAKAAYEEIKAVHGEAALCHPARYTLVEVVNLHDEALQFEPIYRVVFGVDPDDFLAELEQYSFALSGAVPPQCARFLSAHRRGTIHFGAPTEQLVVGTLQTFIDRYVAAHPGAYVDYIHGAKTVERLSAGENTVGFLFDCMEKAQLFPTVMREGTLPRKSFSMGAAADKRFYLECRKIR